MRARVVAISQARMTSTRLPGKVLMEVGDTTLLGLHLGRIASARSLSGVVVATTDAATDDPTEEAVTSLGIACVRGSESDVLDRFVTAVRSLDEMPDWIVRLTADCPLLDPALIDAVVGHAIHHDLDYCSNTMAPRYPDGQDVEVVRTSALLAAWSDSLSTVDREHVTPFIWRNSSFMGGTRFVSQNFVDTDIDYSDLRMTVDEPEDFAVIESLVGRLGPNRSWADYARELRENESIRVANAKFERNEGFARSVAAESVAVSSAVSSAVGHD